MADYYTEASFVIPVKDPALAEMRVANIRAYVEDGNDDALGVGKPDYRVWLAQARENGYLGVEVEIQGDTVWFHANESIDMEAAIAVARILLDLDENPDTFGAEWSNTCSKARLDAFGGGCVAFNRHGEEWATTSEMLRELSRKLEAQSCE